MFSQKKEHIQIPRTAVPGKTFQKMALPTAATGNSAECSSAKKGEMGQDLNSHAISILGSKGEEIPKS